MPITTLEEGIVLTNAKLNLTVGTEWFSGTLSGVLNFQRQTTSKPGQNTSCKTGPLFVGLTLTWLVVGMTLTWLVVGIS